MGCCNTKSDVIDESVNPYFDQTVVVFPVSNTWNRQNSNPSPYQNTWQYTSRSQQNTLSRAPSIDKRLYNAPILTPQVVSSSPSTIRSSTMPSTSPSFYRQVPGYPSTTFYNIYDNSTNIRYTIPPQRPTSPVRVIKRNSPPSSPKQEIPAPLTFDNQPPQSPSTTPVPTSPIMPFSHSIVCRPVPVMAVPVTMAATELPRSIAPMPPLHPNTKKAHIYQQDDLPKSLNSSPTAHGRISPPLVPSYSSELSGSYVAMDDHNVGYSSIPMSITNVDYSNSITKLPSLVIRHRPDSPHQYSPTLERCGTYTYMDGSFIPSIPMSITNFDNNMAIVKLPSLVIGQGIRTTTPLSFNMPYMDQDNREQLPP